MMTIWLFMTNYAANGRSCRRNMSGDLPQCSSSYGQYWDENIADDFKEGIFWRNVPVLLVTSIGKWWYFTYMKRRGTIPR
jgi:hypothetical protein